MVHAVTKKVVSVFNAIFVHKLLDINIPQYTLEDAGECEYLPAVIKYANTKGFSWRWKKYSIWRVHMRQAYACTPAKKIMLLSPVCKKPNKQF
jgi:hypothetical protein